MRKMIREGSLGLMFLATASLLSFATGCGGGGGTRADTGDSGGTGDTSVPGLAVADQMSLVTDGSASASLSPISRSLRALQAVIKNAPTGGDYLADDADVATYFYDESMEILDIPNEILCEFNQVHYWEMVNRGPYLAQVNLGLCEQNEDHSGDQNSEASAAVVELENWIVDVTRECDTCDQIVKMWVEITDEEDFADEIRAKMVISEADSEANPFGTFTLNMAEYASGNLLFTGSLSSATTDDGLIDLQLAFEAEGFESGQLHGLFTLNEDGGFRTGAAYGIKTFVGDGLSGMEKSISTAKSATAGETSQGTMQIAFNDNYYRTHGERGEAEHDRCLARNDPEEIVWRYNLYDSEGTRKELNGGTPIRYGEDWGWASYYGIWLPPGIGAINGLTVTNDEGDTSYNIFVAPGRLIKRTKQELTLGDVVNKPFQHWNEATGSEDRVEWNGSNFVKTGEQVCTQDGPCSIQSVTPEVQSYNEGDWVGGWIEGLGSVDVDNPRDDSEGDPGLATFSNDTLVFIYVESFVTPNDILFAAGDLSLQCYERCLIPNGDYNTGDVYFPDVEEDGEPYLYTIDSGLDLKYQGESVAMALGDPIDGPNSWGANSGPMVPASVELAGRWEANEQTVTYVYESGPNDWNHYMALQDSNGVAVTFDPPLHCVAELTTDDIALSDPPEESEPFGIYALEYAGVGELHGIPWEKEENEETSFERWGPAFAVKDGTQIVCDGVPYFTKAMEKELRMREVDGSFCADLDFESVSEPTLVFEDPAIGDTPTVTDAPVFVGDVRQE